MPRFPSVRVLNAEAGRYSEAAKAVLRGIACVDDAEADREWLLANGDVYDVFLIALRTTIDKEILDRATKLKVIVTPTTGLNHIDMTEAAARGIAVVSLRGETAFLENVTATAELTWGLLLALIRKIPFAYRDVMDGQWRRNDFMGAELKNKTLGVIGCGRLGRMTARYGHAFRMNVLAFDTAAEIDSPGTRFVDLETLLKESDVVSLHLPLNEETRGFVSRARFAAMKDGAVFLNTARGEIADEAALLESLQSGKLAGAAVDVLADETSGDPHWLAGNALRAYARAHENLLMVPHIGGVTRESVEDTNLFIIRKLEAFLETMKAGA